MSCQNTEGMQDFLIRIKDFILGRLEHFRGEFALSLMEGEQVIQGLENSLKKVEKERDLLAQQYENHLNSCSVEKI
jgi:hypothetical protein